MNKYYVRILDRVFLTAAKDELDACVRVSKMYNITTANVTWVISERGFEKHDDDVLIHDDLIMEMLQREEK
tara:strand:- start:778 stop:990 length:213 start_codon:yes stop_codon:yes gene_type:complete